MMVVVVVVVLWGGGGVEGPTLSDFNSRCNDSHKRSSLYNSELTYVAAAPTVARQ